MKAATILVVLLYFVQRTLQQSTHITSTSTKLSFPMITVFSFYCIIRQHLLYVFLLCITMYLSPSLIVV